MPNPKGWETLGHLARWKRGAPRLGLGGRLTPIPGQLGLSQDNTDLTLPLGGTISQSYQGPTTLGDWLVLFPEASSLPTQPPSMAQQPF